jgi:protein PsiE
MILLNLVKKNFFVFNRYMKENKWLQQFIWFSEGVILAAIALATLFAAFMELERIIMVQVVDLSDLFLLFIYAEVLGMVGIFYRDKRIPVTLPIIIAITALTRMIVIQSKGFDGINIIYEASGILLLAVSAYIMTMKDKISLSKIKLRKEAAAEENQEQ